MSMAVSKEYLTYVTEQLVSVPGLRSRRMFGGVGLYGGELFFAVIDDNTLYFKTDEGNRGDFTRLGMQPFRPYADRPDYSMAYFEVPAEVIEDAEELTRWAMKALDAAGAAPARKARRARKAAGTPPTQARGAR